jgi:predicted nucleic acid-binding protein
VRNEKNSRRSALPSRKRRRPRGVVDTSVLVAGIAGFKSVEIAAKGQSSILIREWVDGDTFTWLVTEEILSEYKEVLARLGVRRNVIGALINRLREEAEIIEVRRPAQLSPDPSDDPFCNCAEEGRADFIVTLNPRDFPQTHLTAKVIAPGEAILTTASQRSPSA